MLNLLIYSSLFANFYNLVSLCRDSIKEIIMIENKLVLKPQRIHRHSVFKQLTFEKPSYCVIDNVEIVQSLEVKEKKI